MTRRIVIADDEPNIVVALEYLLAREGFDVRVARDGDEALRHLVETFRAELALLDVTMPRRSGVEVCRKLQQLPELAGLKIVMLTAKGRETEVELGLSAGADLYVTKPFSTRDLVTRVVTLLSPRA